MNSPCLRCTRVRNPQTCENKLCKDWQAWFLHRWESMRANVRTQLESTPAREIGVPLGGHLYVSPHRFRAYMEGDPCLRCPSTMELCMRPCPTKLIWAEVKCEGQR